MGRSTGDIDSFLAHYGVLGMKWGVRKQPKRSRWAKKAGSPRAFRKAYNAVAREMNSGGLAEFNNKPQYRDKSFLKDPKAKAAYYRDYEKTFAQRMTVHADRIQGKSKTGERVVYESPAPRTMMSVIIPAEVKHSADSDIRYKLELRKDSSGLITEVILQQEDEIEQSVQDGLFFLAHYGIPGMKWGHRKTSAGTESEDVRVASEAAKKAKQGGIHTLSNKELQTLISRMNLERQYSSIKPMTNTEKTAKFVRSTLATVGKQQVLAVASSVAAKQVARLIKNAV